MVSTGAFHLSNLFLFSSCHIPTNSVAPFSTYKHKHTQPTIPPITLTKELCSHLWFSVQVRNLRVFNFIVWHHVEFTLLLTHSIVGLIFFFNKCETHSTPKRCMGWSRGEGEGTMRCLREQILGSSSTGCNVIKSYHTSLFFKAVRDPKGE